METKVLSTREVAERLDVDITTIQRWVLQGHFPNAHKAGPGRTSPYRIPLEDVEALEVKISMPRSGDREQ
jgi:excisionase family DNA binding protein